MNGKVIYGKVIYTLENKWYNAALVHIEFSNKLIKLINEKKFSFFLRNSTTEHIFKMFNINITTPICYKRPNFRQNICLKSIKEKYFIGTCNVNVIDHRISCRSSNDRMSWYRGMQSVSFSLASLPFLSSIN